jgi:hypothetical protein
LAAASPLTDPELQRALTDALARLAKPETEESEIC